MDVSYLSLEGKVALITGGCRGIGKAIAVAFADAGADLAFSCRNQPHLDELAEEIKGLGREALPVAAHNRKTEELENLFNKTMEKYGKIDILVNNAAANPAMGYLVDMEEKIYDLIMLTNLKSYTYLSQLVGKQMRDRGSGNIVNISSVGGISPDKGLGLYCISKAGINMLTKSMAVEMGPHNIRVNCIAPGVVKTKFSEALWSNEELMKGEMANMALQRIAEPEEVARAALFFASDASPYITGQTLVMDGGSSL